MREITRFFIVLLTIVMTNNILFGQSELDNFTKSETERSKLNKKELREYVSFLENISDSLLRNKSGTIVELQSQLEERKKRIISIENEIVRLKTLQSKLEAEKSELESEKSKLESEKSELESGKSELESEKSKLESEKSELENKLEKLSIDTQDKEIPKTEEEIISDIREKFGAVNYNINSYRKVKKDLIDESTEGGELEAYFKKEELKKIVVSYYGEMGKLIKEYYFWDNDLFFVFTQEYSYDMPMYMDGSKVDKIDENRYYIHNDKLIRWLDPNKEKVVKSKFIQKETEVLQNAKTLKEKVK